MRSWSPTEQLAVGLFTSSLYQNRAEFDALSNTYWKLLLFLFGVDSLMYLLSSGWFAVF